MGLIILTSIVLEFCRTNLVVWILSSFIYKTDKAKVLLLFQESIATEFLNRMVKWIKNIKISDPLEEGCRLGPVVSEGQVYFHFLFLYNVHAICLLDIFYEICKVKDGYAFACPSCFLLFKVNVSMNI